MNFLSRPVRAAAVAVIVALLAGCGSLSAPRSTAGDGPAPAHDPYYRTFPQ